jgi:hypothetical protein
MLLIGRPVRCHATNSWLCGCTFGGTVFPYSWHSVATFDRTASRTVRAATSDIGYRSSPSTAGQLDEPTIRFSSWQAQRRPTVRESMPVIHRVGRLLIDVRL